MLEEILWTEKYRPHRVVDIILPLRTKSIFQGYVDQGFVPNMTLASGPGTGKTTAAKAMLDEIGADYIMINASLEGNIDTLRNKIQTFASAVSFSGGRKYVILDEADHMNHNSTGPALRGFIEEFSTNCGFILTCNQPNRIMDAIRSRCPVTSLDIQKSDYSALAPQFMRVLCKILDGENVKYDTSVLAEIIKKFMPDWRRTLNEVQKYSPSGNIDTGILANLQDISIKKLMEYLKDRDFTNMRKWVGENSDGDIASVYRKLYDGLSSYVKLSSLPALILILGKYQYQHSLCADQEINLACCLTELMMESDPV